MNPVHAYQAAKKTTPPLIETVLTWFEQVTKRLDYWQNQPQHPSRNRWLHEARLLLGSMITGINPTATEVDANLFRYYRHVLFLINDPTPVRLKQALDLLNGLKESYESIQDQAISLERNGSLTRSNVARLSVVG